MSADFRKSVSGVRPFLAFGSIALGFLAVLLQISRQVQAEAVPSAALQGREGAYKESPRATLTDRNGTVLAVSRPRLAFVVSPFNLWMRHTPERIAGRLAEVLDEPDPSELFRRLAPAGEDGFFVADRWPLTFEEALGLRDWIDGGGPLDQPQKGALPGLDLVPFELAHLEQARRADGTFDPQVVRWNELLQDCEGPFFCLRWQPERLLSQGVRENFAPHLIGKRGASSRWVATLARGLFEHLAGARERERLLQVSTGEALAGWEIITEAPPAPRGLAVWIERLRKRLGVERSVPKPGQPVLRGTPAEWVFGGLCPQRYTVVLDPVPPALVEPLRAAFAQEQLSPFEAWLEPTHERIYPAGELALLGSYGWIQRRDEQDRTQLEHAPLAGLEHVAHAVLEDCTPFLAQEFGAGALALLREGRAGWFDYELKVPRQGWQHSYFSNSTGSLEPARVESTIDLDLQRFVGAKLDQLQREQDTALCMAIALDLGTREVLALDWRDRYGCSAFAPIQHQFTPGSTFKLVTMALALEGGHVRPESQVDVGEHGYVSIRAHADGTGRTRLIREAEGYARGVISAAECIARSSNGGMVQIGLRVPAETWQAETLRFGYGRVTAPELLARGMFHPPGRIGENRDDPGVWDRLRSHASVCFGDAVSTNLIQHVGVIAGLLGGGVGRPLVFARAVEFGGRRFEPELSAGERLVSRATSDELRAMMELGAHEGTGRDLERPAGLELKTKTGTTEKLRFDVCQHQFGAAWQDALARREADSWDPAAMHRQFAGQFRGSKSCYVSSIVCLGTDPTGEREVLVMVVVDDAHGEEKFGSKVAGPTGVAILSEALGHTHLGVPRGERDASGLVTSSQVAPRGPVEPWASRPSDEASEARWWDEAELRGGAQ